MVEFSGDAAGAPTHGAAQSGEADTVFCGNLGFYTTEETVRGFFEVAGEVATVRIA